MTGSDPPSRSTPPEAPPPGDDAAPGPDGRPGSPAARGSYGPSPVEVAATALWMGRLVAFPTETVYGLGADARNPEAVARIFAVKGRPTVHPLIVHVADGGMLDEIALEVPDAARRLAAALWPGPLTLVVRRRPGAVAEEVAAGLPTVGVRVPGHSIGLALLRAFGGPVAAPSANRFGAVSPTTAAHVLADLGDAVDVVLDGGPCPVGVESTIVDCTGGLPTDGSGGELRILRLGGVPAERLAEIVGYEIPVGGTTAAPGTLASHYAPRARVEVVRDGPAARARAHELTAAGTAVAVIAPGRTNGGSPPAVLDGRGGTGATEDAEGTGGRGDHGHGAGPDPEPGGGPPRLVELDVPDDPEGYARVLYARLREADELGVEVVVAAPPPGRSGLADTVADRLRRAAGPR